MAEPKAYNARKHQTPIAGTPANGVAQEEIAEHLGSAATDPEMDDEDDVEDVANRVVAIDSANRAAEWRALTAELGPVRAPIPPRFTHLHKNFWTDGSAYYELLPPPGKDDKRPPAPPGTISFILDGTELRPWFRNARGVSVFPRILALIMPADDDPDPTATRKYIIQILGVGDDRPKEITQEEIRKGSWVDRWPEMPPIERRNDINLHAELIVSQIAALSVKAERALIRTGFTNDNGRWEYVRPDQIAEGADGSTRKRMVRDLKFPLQSLWEKTPVAEIIPEANQIRETIDEIISASPKGHAAIKICNAISALVSQFHGIGFADRSIPKDPKVRTGLGKTATTNLARCINGPCGCPREAEGVPELNFEGTRKVTVEKANRFGDVYFAIDDDHPGVNPKEALQIAVTANRAASDGGPSREAWGSKGRQQPATYVKGTPSITRERSEGWTQSDLARGIELAFAAGDVDGTKIIACINEIGPILSAIGRRERLRLLKFLDAFGEARLSEKLKERVDFWRGVIRFHMDAAIPDIRDDFRIIVSRSWAATMIGAEMLDEVCGTGSTWVEAVLEHVKCMATEQALVAAGAGAVDGPSADRFSRALRKTLKRGYGVRDDGADLSPLDTKSRDLSHLGYRYTNGRWVKKDNGSAQLCFYRDKETTWLIPKPIRDGVSDELGEDLDAREFNRRILPYVDLKRVDKDKDRIHRTTGNKKIGGEARRLIPIPNALIDDDGSEDDNEIENSGQLVDSPSPLPPLSLDISPAHPFGADPKADNPTLNATPPPSPVPPTIPATNVLTAKPGTAQATATAPKTGPQKSAVKAKKDLDTECRFGVLDLDGLRITDALTGEFEFRPADQSMNPAGSDIGTLARLLTHYGLCQLWVQKPWAIAAGLPEENSPPPDYKDWHDYDPFPHPFGSTNRPLPTGCRIGKRGYIASWVRVSAGRAIVIPHLGMGEADPGWSEASAEDLLYALIAFRLALGRPFKISPQVMLADLIRSTVRPEWYAPTQYPADFPVELLNYGLAHHGVNFSRELTDDERKGSIYGYDCVNRFLADFNVPCGIGAPYYVTKSTFNPKAAGWYFAEVDLPENWDPLLPDPRGDAHQPDVGLRWFHQERMQLMIDLGCRVKIKEAWLFPERHVVMYQAYKLLYGAIGTLTEAADREPFPPLKDTTFPSLPKMSLVAAKLALNAVKLIYSAGNGSLSKEEHQPYWAQAVQERGRCRQLRALVRRDLRPFATRADAFYIASSKSSPQEAVAPMPLGGRPGHYLPIKEIRGTLKAADWSGSTRPGGPDIPDLNKLRRG